ncbi:signal peptide [Acinetobacter baumannii]|nr:signal peptide [Acinetobacter baumannii]SSS47655.1 signal peptide [Acinetobacter baumannii]
MTIVHNLKNVGGNSYENGTILDPKSGKTYKLKGELAEGGKKLKLRGYIGVSALGRNQTWIRAN